MHSESPTSVSLLTPSAPQVEDWNQVATRACSDAVGLIDRVLGQPVDGDIKVCLEAVRNSLNWVLNEPASARELRLTINRAVEIFSKTGIEPPDSLTAV